MRFNFVTLFKSPHTITSGLLAHGAPISLFYSASSVIKNPSLSIFTLSANSSIRK